jgi:hypothetical protein
MQWRGDDVFGERGENDARVLFHQAERRGLDAAQQRDGEVLSPRFPNYGEVRVGEAQRVIAAIGDHHAHRSEHLIEIARSSAPRTGVDVDSNIRAFAERDTRYGWLCLGNRHCDQNRTPDCAYLQCRELHRRAPA